MRKRDIGLLLAFFAMAPQFAFAQASPFAFTYAYRYNAMRQVTGTIAPAGSDSSRYSAVRNTYDAEGRVTRVDQGELATWPGNADPVNWSGFNIVRVTNITYDSGGRKLTEWLSSGGVAYALTQYSYDAEGRLECTAVRMKPSDYGSLPGSACSLGAEGISGPDRITRNYYNSVGQLASVKRAVGTAVEQTYVSYTYTSNGKQETIKDARNYLAKMEYDGFDRLSDWKFPDPNSTNTVSSGDYEHYTYDANGNRLSLRKRDTRTISYGYDALNRVVSKTYPNGGARPVYYRYNLIGNTTRVKFDDPVNGEGMVRGYDGFGQLRSDQISLPGISTTISYPEYDAHGNRKRMNYGDGNYVTYTYDGLDRPTFINRSGSALVASYTYDAAGLRATFGGGYTTSYGYDGAGRLTNQTVTPANASYRVQYGFGYNPASQIIRESRDNIAYAWTGLATATNNYGTANGLNQYGSIDGTVMEYDANGNLKVDRKSSTTPINYTYDIENRLTSASGGYNASLAYDPLGRLYEVSGTKFIYDGDALIQELNSSGTTLRRYIHGVDAGDDPIAWYEGAEFSDSNERLMRSNHQSSITIVADRTTATIHGINTYDEYGKPGSGNLGRFQYTGQAWIPELGLYHYKARAYSPKLGRFLQMDPVGYKDDINLYTYVMNDPLNKIDPSGLTCRGTGEDSKCTVDYVNVGSAKNPNWVGRQDGIKSGKVTEKQLGRLESNMTKGYVAAQKLGNNTVTVKGNSDAGTKDTQVSGNDIAKRLQHTSLNVDNRSATSTFRDASGQTRTVPITAETPLGSHTIQFYRGALNEGDRAQSVTTVHEAMHNIPTLFTWARGQNSMLHQEPFDNAANSVMGP